MLTACMRDTFTVWQGIDDLSVYDEELIWEKGWGGAEPDLGRYDLRIGI